MTHDKLREAIRAELASMQNEGLIGTVDGWVVPRLADVFEAYLREQDTIQRRGYETGIPIVTLCLEYAEGVDAERERIRQRIEALPTKWRWTTGELVTPDRPARPDEVHVVLADVLEALEDTE